MDVEVATGGNEDEVGGKEVLILKGPRKATQGPRRSNRFVRRRKREARGKPGPLFGFLWEEQGRAGCTVQEGLA